MDHDRHAIEAEEDGSNSSRGMQVEGISDDVMRTDDENDEMATSPPPAREHSYFPGASHPLHSATVTNLPTGVSSNVMKSRSLFSRARCEELFDLVVIELPGVVLVPGMTIPLRLEEPGSFESSSGFWMLHRQIQDSRRAPGQADTVQVGVLTRLDPSEETGELLSTTRGGRVDSNQSIRRRRSSWMRRRFGPERLRRFSEQLIQEMGDIQAFLEEVESVDEAFGADDTIPPQPPPEPRTRRQRRTTFDNRRVVQREMGDNDNGEDDEGPSEETSPGEVAFLHRRRSSSRNNGNNNNNSAVNRQSDPYADRIGTLATVTCTHGDEDDVLGRRSVDSMGNGPRSRVSLLLTAVGTGRFRIPCRDTARNETSTSRSAVDSVHNDPFNHLRIFVRTVQEWSEERIPALPLHGSFPVVSAGPRRKYDMATLASVSAWPEHVYRSHWPWNLMRALKRRMAAVPTLKEILTTQEENVPDDPFRFSYWLAMNLPLSEHERLKVLQSPTVTERLRWFLCLALFDVVPPEDEDDGRNQDDLADASDCKDFICKSCQIPIAQASHLFTLGGAEGTVGNYVNEFGVVHATMTVRQVDQNEVILTGRPETKNSWFPGYAWTIMSCALCYSHLGWKFTRAGDSTPVSTMRPELFYGLSASGITLTTNMHRHRQVPSSRHHPSDRRRATARRTQGTAVRMPTPTNAGT